MNDEASRIARSEAAKQAWDQFTGPAFAVVRADYLEKLAEIAARPLTADMRAGMEKLALAIKVLDEASAQIRAVIMDGKIADHDADRGRQMAALTTEQKRWASW